MCRPRTLRRQKRESGDSGVNADAEARRIAAELVKLHKAGAIKSEQDAGQKISIFSLTSETVKDKLQLRASPLSP